MTDNIKTEQTGSDAYPDLAVRLGKLLEQYHTAAGLADDLREPALLILSEVLQMTKENVAIKAKLEHSLKQMYALCEFQTQVVAQVEPYLGEPPSVYAGEPNVMQLHDASTIGPALESMRARHDQMEGALKPLAGLSVPEDFIPDYFTDPDFYGPTTEAETSDYFIRRQDIRRAREALGTYPRPEGYPFTEKD